MSEREKDVQVVMDNTDLGEGFLNDFDDVSDAATDDAPPVCTIHGAGLVYDVDDAMWICEVKGCVIRIPDPYEWDPDYDPDAIKEDGS